ncbi:myosin-10 protein, putative (macronuclear) [Tetrahymena thermophila SB210]|uniref:Myosin-10 protein, putative n=1 Tax=Tetrahymena thermophila (strain SB210) TaxID=312017 RepID=A4VDC9_TETTS|nr:myosin-10 protein, putative [Tetrahymena thermophila SB210]EDK31517.2 myosin-10 protein, putative [Tetrahymena thermophila SB210]|eukprot:XP_001470897.2 myosin-10 protein, putative [Tetrahymena thermophila SB210]
MNKKCIQHSNIFNLQQFKAAIKQTIYRIYDNFTVDAALSEMKQILTNYGEIGKQERLSALCDMLLESNNNLNSKQKKDLLKVLGIIGEIYQKYVFISWNKICKVLQKKICDDDANTYLALAENVGILVQKAFQIDQSSQDYQEFEIKQFWDQLMGLYFSLIQCPNSSLADKKKSVASSMCLSISIQSIPQLLIIDDRINICLQIMKPIEKTNIAAENQLLDCLLSLIVACEEQFEDCCEYCVPFVIDQLSKEQNIITQNAINMNINSSSSNWQKRKICIDIIYTLSVLTPPYISLYKDQCVEVVSSFKYDKIKSVREAAQVALVSLQDLPTLREQKYVQNVSSENLSSTPKEQSLISSKREGRALYGNQSLKNLKGNHIEQHILNEQNGNQLNELVEQKEETQSNSSMPLLETVDIDQETIEQALEKLKQIQDQEQNLQKQHDNIKEKENQKQEDFENQQLKVDNKQQSKIPGLKRLSPDYKKQLQVKKEMKFDKYNSSPPNQFKQKKDPIEKKLNKNFFENAPKNLIEIKLNEGQQNQEDHQNRSKLAMHKSQSLSLIDNKEFQQPKVQEQNSQKFQNKNLDKDLKQIDENIKKIQSDLKVYQDLLSSGDKDSKQRLSVSPQNLKNQSKNGSNQSLEEFDQREKSLPKNTSFSPSRNYMQNNNQNKKRKKIFENTPISPNAQLMARSSIINNGLTLQNNSKVFNQVNNTTPSNSDIQIQDDFVKRSSTYSPAQRSLLKPQSISPNQQNQLNIQSYYQKSSQRQYKPIFQQSPSYQRSASYKRLNNFDQQLAQISESNLQFNISQHLNNEPTLYLDKIRQLEDENQKLRIKLNETKVQKEQIEKQLNQQIIEVNNKMQNLIQQLSQAQTEKQSLMQEHLEKENNLQSVIHQLNVQIQDLQIRIEQLLSQQIDQGTQINQLGLNQQNIIRTQFNNMIPLNQNNSYIQNGINQLYLPSYQITQIPSSLNKLSPHQHTLQMQNQQSEKKILLLNQITEANTIKKVYHNNHEPQQFNHSQYFRRANKIQDKQSQIRSISPLQGLESHDQNIAHIHGQEQTAKFCQNNKFNFDQFQKQEQLTEQMQKKQLGDSFSQENKGMTRNDSQTFKRQTFKHEIQQSFSPKNSFVPSSNYWKDQNNDEFPKQINENEEEISLKQLNKTIQKVEQAINVSNNHIIQFQSNQNTKNEEKPFFAAEKKQNGRKRSLLNGVFKEINTAEKIESQQKIEESYQASKEKKYDESSIFPQINILLDSQTKLQSQQINIQKQFETEKLEQQSEQSKNQNKRTLNPYQKQETFQQKVDYNIQQQNQIENIDQVFEFLQDQKYNEALSIALTQQDDDFLIQVLKLSEMEDCINKLDDTHSEYLLTKLKGMLYNRQYLDQCIPWITQIVKSNVSISQLLLNSLIDTIKIILDQQQNPYEPNQSITQEEQQSIQQILQIAQQKI